tara:strand:- start:3350 stop:3529 length:180 start_codon:yes stop_codon:yes gene_type:complete
MNKLQEKKNFIFKALQNGYSVKKNIDGTYTFTRDKSEGNEPLKTFVRRCNIKLNFSNFK